MVIAVDPNAAGNRQKTAPNASLHCSAVRHRLQWHSAALARPGKDPRTPVQNGAEENNPSIRGPLVSSDSAVCGITARILPARPFRDNDRTTDAFRLSFGTGRPEYCRSDSSPIQNNVQGCLILNIKAENVQLVEDFGNQIIYTINNDHSGNMRFYHDSPKALASFIFDNLEKLNMLEGSNQPTA